MTKEEIFALAARHLASGKKMIFSMCRQVPVGYVLRRWTVSQRDGDEMIEDQTLIVIRASTFEEYVENFPPEFGPVQGTPKPGRDWFYEVTCE